jgi:hypothetical protein
MPLDYATYEAHQEQANFQACFNAFARLTTRVGMVLSPRDGMRLAETCNDGEFNCPTCPWRKEK